MLAGISPTWYSYLEQGRDINPSPSVLDRIAEVLNLTEDERRYAYLLALGHPPGVRPEPPDPRNDLWQEILRTVGGGPYPAYVGNQYGAVLAWNQATVEWYTDFAKFPGERRNMLWWMFTAPEARERFVEWSAETRDLVARLRATYAVRLHDHELRRLVHSLARVSPEFRHWWSEHHVRDPHIRSRKLRVPRKGVLEVHLVALQMTDDPFNSVILHLPASDGNGESASEESRLETD